MMTDVLFSLSFSLNWRKEKSILEFERNSPPTKKRERRTRLLYTNVYENFGKKKANLKRVPFSLFFSLSLFQRRRERMNQRQQQEQHLLYIQVWGRAILFLIFSPFFLFFLSLELRTKTLAFLCVCLCRRRLLFFFFEPTQQCETIYARTKTRESFLLSSFARLLLIFCLTFSLSLSHSLSLSDEE